MRHLSIAAASLLWLPAAALAQTHWSYEGEAAPANWGKLDAKFAACAAGRNQSPIDLADFVKADLKPLKLNYSAGATEILNNGHTIQVNYAPGSSLVVDGHEFELKQFHFHAPSENRINGRQFPLEGHLVHADKDGNLAVVAVLFAEGVDNGLLAKLWEKMPGKKDEKSALASGLTATQLLPAKRDYYRYSGSLTTPPCSEGVLWLVVKAPSSASKAQIEKFARTMGVANNRPVQAVNARAVLR
jgi:carbonic anhydrase